MLAIIKELRQVAKQEALDALEGMEKFNVSGEEVVETIRKIRKEESARLDLNH